MIDERIAALSVRALRSKGVAPRMRQKRVETIVAIQVLRAIAAPPTTTRNGQSFLIQPFEGRF
jgi:hypothetical protein